MNESSIINKENVENRVTTYNQRSYLTYKPAISINFFIMNKHTYPGRVFLSLCVVSNELDPINSFMEFGAVVPMV